VKNLDKICNSLFAQVAKGIGIVDLAPRKSADHLLLLIWSQLL